MSLPEGFPNRIGWGLFIVIITGPVLFIGLTFQQLSFQQAGFGALLLAVPFLFFYGVKRELDMAVAQPLGLLALWTLLSVSWSEGTQPLFVSASLVINWLAVVAFLVLTGYLSRQQTLMEKVLLGLALLMSALALFSLVWQFGVLDRPLTYRGFRIASAGVGAFANLYNPIDAGLYYGVFATLLFYGVCHGSCRWLRSVCAYALVPLIIYLSLTYSRGAIFSCVAGALVVCAFAGKRALFWCSGMVLAVVLLLVLGENWLLQAEMEKGFNGRGPIWEHSWQLVQQAPILGHGAGQVFDYPIPWAGVSYPFAHNYLLTLWNYYGLIGVALFLWLTAVVFYRCWQNRAAPFYGLVAGLLTFGLVGMQSYVDELIRLPHQYWLLFWLPVGMVLSQKGSGSFLDNKCT